MLGLSPAVTLACTLPELKFAMRGYQRAHGINPDKDMPDARSKAMSGARLNELLERYA
ncbi:hypothetical protein [Kordiimonas aestuarii]|uniref:hypothetical protein n=1 Tax=Kordiimonas aestuarii TaxID=1005925 RepID=UPI0021CFB398|nr:hypothetical protein [Kordiimonas aestuarii]